jgi:hypothetical protein
LYLPEEHTVTVVVANVTTRPEEAVAVTARGEVDGNVLRLLLGVM